MLNLSILKELLLEINELNTDKKINIFTFGVGRDGNDSGWMNDLSHSFLKSLSVNNGGFYQRIKQGTADIVMSDYFKMLSKPILNDIKITYTNKNISELTTTSFNTLYQGNDLIIAGKIQNKSSFAVANFKTNYTNNNNKTSMFYKFSLF